MIVLCSWCYKCWNGSDSDGSESEYSSSSDSLSGIPTHKYRATINYSSLQDISPPYTPQSSRTDAGGLSPVSLKFPPPPPHSFEFKAQQPASPSEVVIPPEPPLPDSCSKEQLGKIYFSLSYDSQDMILTVKILKATGLPAKDFSGTSDPFVKIFLLPDKKHKLETRVKRKNLNPIWSEVFTFEGFPHNKLLSRTLYLQVLDYDRFSRNDLIGEVLLPLSDVDLGPMPLTFCKELQPCKRGQVSVSLLDLLLLYYHHYQRVLYIHDETNSFQKFVELHSISFSIVRLLNKRFVPLVCTVSSSTAFVSPCFCFVLFNTKLY